MIVLRTHPDDGTIAGKASSRLMLVSADQIMMDDGTIVRDWPILVADASVIGAGGLDAGPVVGDTWYQVHAIRNSSDDTRALLLHRHKNYKIDQQQTSGVAQVPLRDAGGRTCLAQKIKTALSGKVEVIDIPIKRVGSPDGMVWFTLEADDNGAPSGTSLARSDNIIAGSLTAAPLPDFNQRIIFRAPATVAPGTALWLVMHGDYNIDGTNYVHWYCASFSEYPSGVPATFNGADWTINTNDMTFKFYVTQNDNPLIMPAGYDQSSLIGYFYTNNEAPHYFDPMIWNDRDATWMVRSTGQGLEAFTNTVPCIRDGNYIFPHGVPVLVDVAVQGAVPGSVVISGLPEGYARGIGQFDNAAGGQITHVNQQIYAGRIATEYGALYAFTTAGIATAFFPSWRR